MAFALGTGFTLDRVALARARLTLAAVALLALLPVLGPATFGSRAAVPSPSELAQPVSDSLASAPEGLRAVASAVINADRSGSVANGRDGVQSERGGGLAAAFPGAGPALTATGVAGRAFLGYSVAMSADGSTALVGAPDDDDNVGAVWVFVQSDTGWTQQGPKLTASGAFPMGQFGWSVALSADGSTALIGSPGDNGGSAWVFTRSGTTWAQQSPRITISAKGPANPNRGPGLFGSSVALSADGNTALVGAPADDNSVGAAWLFTRSGSVWTQLGPVLQPTFDANAQFGQAVALSADGSIAAVGAGYDQSLVGAVWLFSVTHSGWTQAGPELTGQGETPATDAFGSSLALSADGSTLLVGGTGAPPGFSEVGAAYVFTRSGSAWSQQGPPLTPTDEAGSGAFGTSVALSADGNTAVIGGEGDSTNVGAAWVFTRSGSAWAQAGSKLLATGESGADGFGSSVAISADGSTALVGATANLANEGAWTFMLSAPTTGGFTAGPVVAVPIHPFVQQGLKLTAGDASGAGGLGASVSLSADGNTALVGAPADDGQVGAAWVFVRTGSTWSQQGPKLTAAGETGPGQFGAGVALSGDGNTAVIGAQADGATGNGAAWVFSRSGQTWTQTAKLTPTGETPASGSIPGGAFGASVALSADGSTALVGAPSEAGRGAAWVFVRNGSAWSQQGNKLFGLSLSSGGALNPDSFGESVALSADGNTALVGAPTDGYFNLNPFPNAGAFFVFTRKGTSWSQQGNELSVHYTSVGFGTAVALSSDGNTALITGPETPVIGPDGSVHDGAAWVFSRTASVWGQLGLIITPDDAGSTSFGTSAAISADGTRLFVGGSADSGQTGAVWQFDRAGFSWVQQGPKLTGSGELGAGGFGGAAAISADGSTALVGGALDDGSVGAAWAFTPALAPDAPSAVVAAPADGQATVSFTPPDSDGGEPIASYTVTASPGGATATGSSSPITVGGLTDGTSYTFTVTATTIAGTGPASAASNAVTPTAPGGRGGYGGGGSGGGGAGTAGSSSGTAPNVPPAGDSAPAASPKPAPRDNPVRCLVPRVTGETLAAARRAVSRAHCAVGRLTSKHSAHVAKGRISGESPRAGKTLAKGGKVDLTVSTGKAKRA